MKTSELDKFLGRINVTDEKKYGLKYHPLQQSWFIGKRYKRKLTYMSTPEFVSRVNAGDINYDDANTDNDYAGGITLIENIEEISSEANDTPPTGLFKLVNDDELGIGITKSASFDSDKYIDLNDKHIVRIREDIESFFASEAIYRELELMHRRGILLYGPPGTGKTSLIKHLVEGFQTKARVILIPSYIRVSTLNSLRKPLSDMHTIFIFEEITSDIDDRTKLTDFLTFLDGEESWDKSLVISTTNYPERLPANLVDRPSRFDKLYKIGFPDETTRRTYLEHKMGKEWTTDEIIKQTDGFSIAYLKELVSSCRIYTNKTPLEVIEGAKARKEEIKKEFADSRDELGKKRRRPGFSGHFDNNDDDFGF